MKALLPLLLALLPGVVLARGDVTRGRAAVEKAQCTRCHDVDGVRAVPQDAACVRCHQWIVRTAANDDAAAEARESFPLWDRHVQRVSTGHYTVGVPSLRGLGRFRRDWLRAYLRNPYDLRPTLSESMPRPGWNDRTVDDVVAFLTRNTPTIPGPVPPREDALVTRGAALFEEKGCVACHLFGNRVFVTAGPEQFTFSRNPGRALAPDLRHTRDRMRPELLTTWIRAPQSLKPDTLMPAVALSEADALALACFILYGEPGTPAPAFPVDNAPPPSGPVTWKAVDERIFSRVCIHCHMDPALSGGDGGPGNSGGFGYPAVGLSFSSYRDVTRGSRTASGRRQSIFRPGASGEPVLLERVHIRHVEAQRDRILPGHDDLRDHRAARPSEPPGMPMGLPALSPEDVALLEAWVRAGHPGPQDPHGNAPAGRKNCPASWRTECACALPGAK
ncbi:MAG: hypothetical protein AB2A00_36100 [Myxococcota bacterium]